MNKHNINILFKIILLNIFLAVDSAIAQGAYSDCKAPCTEFIWTQLTRVTKAAPVITIAAPEQEYMLFDIANPGIICPDSKPPATPPKQTHKYGKEKKEHMMYEIEVGARWETFRLNEKVSGDKSFCEVQEAKIEVIGYCRHVSACIAKSDKVTTVNVISKSLLHTFINEEILHTYSLFYKSPAISSSPNDPDCKAKCDDF